MQLLKAGNSADRNGGNGKKRISLWVALLRNAPGAGEHLQGELLMELWGGGKGWSPKEGLGAAAICRTKNISGAGQVSDSHTGQEQGAQQEEPRLTGSLDYEGVRAQGFRDPP